MELEDIKYLSGEQLSVALATVTEDLKKAVNDEPNSERHMECFAAFILLSEEVARRNNQLPSV